MAIGGMDLRPLLAPKSIAVVGASDHSGPGKQVLDNLEQLGYTGDVWPVNPKYDKVAGRRCYGSLSDIDKPVDMVAIVLGRDRIIPVLEEAAAIGVKAAWAFASGFAEAGQHGRKLQDSLEEFCQKNQIAFCGPNCVGYLNPLSKSCAYSAPVSHLLTPGRVGAVVQSGSICLALANSNRGLGYSLLVSSGNEAVLDSTDYISYMLEDDGTAVVLAFIEQFRRPDRLVEVAARAREVGKPLVVLKVGRSQMARQAAMTHTGALTGSDAVYDAVFNKYGIIRVDSLDEMLETAAAFSGLGDNLPAGNRVGMITVSGGEIGLIGDLTENLDVEFPDWSAHSKEVFQQVLPEYSDISNPLDAWGNGKVEETYPPSIAAAVKEDVDLVLVSQDSPTGMAPAQVDQYAVVADAAVDAARKSSKPIIAISNLAGGLDSQLQRAFWRGGIPLLQGTEPALRAVDHVISYGKLTSKQSAIGSNKSRSPKVDFPFSSERVITEDQVKTILSANGIPCVQEILCQNADEAGDAFLEIGAPVVVKLISPDIPHKTDAQVVYLNVTDEEELKRAYKQVLSNARRHSPKARITGVLVQQMITDPVCQVILGVSRDKDFGPIMLFGMGGTMAELYGDRTLGIPPLTRQEATDMVHGTRVSNLLRGFRGRPLGDEEALIEVLARLGEIAIDWGDRLEALDINPLLVLPVGRGVVAVDALIETRCEGGS